MSLPEHVSIPAFIQYLRDDERTTFTAEDLSSLNESLHLTFAKIRAALEAEGFSLVPRKKTPMRVRGFSTSSNDRWYGPGSDKTHGGSGF